MTVKSIRRALITSCAAAVGAASLVLTSPVVTRAAGTQISLAVPAYFTDDALWQKVIDSPAVLYVIGHPLAPVAGQPYKADQALEDHLAAAKAKGKVPLVYVTGGYDKEDWTVVADKIDTVLKAYPAAGGVFIDEINYDQCAKYSSLMKGTATDKGVRVRDAGKYIILNPGAPLLNCYDGLADGYVNLERADKDIAAWTSNVTQAGNASAYSWMFTDPNRARMWEIIHSVSASGGAAAVDAALARNAGVLYFTDDVMPNPYDSLPSEAMWKTIIDRVNQYNSGAVPLPASMKLAAPTTVATVPPTAAPTTVAAGSTSASSGSSAATTVKPGTKTTKKKTITKKKTTKKK